MAITEIDPTSGAVFVDTRGTSFPSGEFDPAESVMVLVQVMIRPDELRALGSNIGAILRAAHVTIDGARLENRPYLARAEQ